MTPAPDTHAEIATRPELLDVVTGEVLPATPETEHRVLTAAREMKARINEVIALTTEYLLDESRRQGTKTFHSPAGDVVLAGGPSVEYDPEALADCLREAGCPEERINEAVVPEVKYTVNRSVLRQLTAANEDYKAAAELAQRTVDRSWRASAK